MHVEGVNKMERIKLFDATLRDGSHAIRHQFTHENITQYCNIIDKAGMDCVIIGHGNGLGASSLQVGLSKLSDSEMLEDARKTLKHTRMGAYMIPGFGTINDDLIPAIEKGVDLFKVGCQCTEADITRQHIEYLAKKNLEVYGVLMMYHMTSTERLLEEAQKMQGYGASGVILMDSAGASTPELVKKTISTLKNGLNIEIGFHAHNNLGLAVSNTYIAVKEGASIIDGTIRGFGAGAGNCPLELIVALLTKEGYEFHGINWYAMLDASDQVVSHFSSVDKGVSGISAVSGVAGVFSAFLSHAINAGKEFGVDPRDIFMELGRRKAMAGQEDMIIDIASELSKQNLLNQVISF